MTEREQLERNARLIRESGSEVMRLLARLERRLESSNRPLEVTVLRAYAACWNYMEEAAVAGADGLSQLDMQRPALREDLAYLRKLVIGRRPAAGADQIDQIGDIYLRVGGFSYRELRGVAEKASKAERGAPVATTTITVLQMSLDGKSDTEIADVLCDRSGPPHIRGEQTRPHEMGHECSEKFRKQREKLERLLDAYTPGWRASGDKSQVV